MECDRDDMIQLKWDNFGDTVIDSFRKFRTEEMFCDVTIWTDEDSFTCHQVILCAFSNFFKRLLSRSQDAPSSAVYLHGLSSSCVRALVTFMYEAELTISQEELPELLDAASVLQIRGLSQVEETGTKCIIFSHQPTKLPFQ